MRMKNLTVQLKQPWSKYEYILGFKFETVQQ